MKIQMRSNVFETNSSSMHSLVICNEDKLKDFYECNQIYLTHDEMLESIHRYIDDNGNLNYKYHKWNFGRFPCRYLYFFEDKLEYLIASYYYWHGEESIESEVIPIIQKLLPEIKGIILPKEGEYGRDICFDEDYYFDWKNEFGFTDEEFLTNPKYRVVQDGDEYGQWLDCFKAGIIDRDMVEIDTQQEKPYHQY